MTHAYYDYEDLYVAIVKNEYEFRPCGTCESGKIYVDGSIGEVITARKYEELMNDPDNEDKWCIEIEICDHCFGTGKLIKLNWDS